MKRNRSAPCFIALTPHPSPLLEGEGAQGRGTVNGYDETRAPFKRPVFLDRVLAAQLVVAAVENFRHFLVELALDLYPFIFIQGVLVRFK